MIARQTVVQTAIGMKGQRNVVVDIFNTYRPKPRGHTVLYTDQLCATFASAVFIKLANDTGDKRWTQIVPPECGAHQLYENMAALGCGVQSKTYVPMVGDLIFFGNSRYISGIAHVGIVTEVTNDKKRVYYYDLQGVVGRHTVPIGYSWIWGYGVPDYASLNGQAVTPEPEPEPVTGTIEAGDLVHIKDGAKWYSGSTIKASILPQNWFVIQNKNGRVVLGMNEAKTSCITSPIHEEDVVLVRKANAETPVAPAEEKVAFTVEMSKEKYELLLIIAEGWKMSLGQVIEKFVEDAR